MFGRPWNQTIGSHLADQPCKDFHTFLCHLIVMKSRTCKSHQLWSTYFRNQIAIRIVIIDQTVKTSASNDNLEKTGLLLQIFCAFLYYTLKSFNSSFYLTQWFFLCFYYIICSFHCPIQAYCMFDALFLSKQLPLVNTVIQTTTKDNISRTKQSKSKSLNWKNTDDWSPI